jgi:hypothetical protein
MYGDDDLDEDSRFHFGVDGREPSSNYDSMVGPICEGEEYSNVSVLLICGNLSGGRRWAGL